jgi:hypothetical protein
MCSVIDETRSPWELLAQQLAESGCRGLVDLYVERRLEVTWSLDPTGIVTRQTVHQDGAAVRRGGMMASSDGAERVVVADLLDVPVRSLPPLRLPRFPEPPVPTVAVLPESRAVATVRYLWRWSAVVTLGRAAFPVRPALCELTFADGRKSLTTWPPPTAVHHPVDRPSAQAVPRAGRVVAVLAPQAAAVLLHEILGHGLEGDLLAAGNSPWVGRMGERITPLPLTLIDDPTLDGLPGSFDVDDEGTRAAPRVLLRDGVLEGALGQRDTGETPGIASGNARRATVHTPPRPRVSNLIADAPSTGAESLLPHAEIEVLEVSSGTLEPRLGVVVLQVRSAFSLRRGRRVRPLAPFTLLGSVPAVSRGLLAAQGPREVAVEPGWCGKEGEVVPISGTSPSLLVSNLEVR